MLLIKIINGFTINIREHNMQEAPILNKFYNVFQKVNDNVSDEYSLIVLQSCYIILFSTFRWEFTPKLEFHWWTSHTQLSHASAYGRSGAVASNSLQCIETRMVLSHRSDLVGSVMSAVNYRKLQRNILFELPQPFNFERAWYNLKVS